MTQLTQQRQMELEQELRRIVAAIAFSQQNDIKNPAQAVARDILPAADLESGTDNGWNGTRNVWEQDHSAGTADAWNEAYSIDSGAKAEDKVLGFLVVRNQTQSPVTSEIRFINQTGSPKDRAQVEGLKSEPDATGYLADVVIYTSSEDGSIDHWIDATGTDTWVLEGAVGEKFDETFASGPTQPLFGAEQADRAEQIATPFLEKEKNGRTAGRQVA